MENLDPQIDLSVKYHKLSDALAEITPWFQSNVESITDAVQCQKFLLDYAKKENELFRLLVSELEVLKGSTKGASLLWLPQPTSGI